MPKRQAQRIIDNRSANRNPTTISGITLTSPGTAYTAGDGLTLTGVVLAVGAGDGISVAADAVAVDSTVVRTTRTVTAGSGLTGGGALSADLTLNVGAGTLITVGADTVGITAGANYQYIGTGSGTAAAWQNLSGLAGAGLTHSAGVLAVGAGNGITVNADNVALTTPGTLTVATSNSSTGNHTHALATSSNPGAAASILASNASGYLQLVRIGLGMAPVKPLSVSGDAGISGNVAAGSLSVSGAATVGQDFTVGANVLYVNQAGTRVGINRAPDQQFDLDVAGAIRGQYLIGKHAIQLSSAVGVWHYDGPAPYNLDFGGSDASHAGVGGTAAGGVIYRPGKFGKSVQIAPATTNLCTNPSFETNTTGWGTDYPAATTLTRVADGWVGAYLLRVAATGTGNFYSPPVTVANATAYAVSFWYRTTSSVSVYVREYGNATNYGTATLPAATEWTRYTILLTTPASASTSIRLVFDGLAVGESIDIDGVQVEQKAYVSPYCDGSLGTGHSWSGTAHASTSSRTGATLQYANAGGLSVQAGTIQMWVRLDSYNADSGGLFGSGANGEFDAYISAAGDVVFRTDGNARSAGTVALGAWTQLAFTWDAAANSKLLYINGVQVASATYAATATLGSTLYIGSITAGAVYSTNGLIDEFVLTDYAMDAKLVRAIYESDAPVFVESSVFHWRSPSRVPIWVDEFGLWARGVSGNEILGLYGGDPRNPTGGVTKSWGGVTLSENDVLIGRAAGGYVFWDDSAQVLNLKGTMIVDGNSYLNGVVTIAAGGELRQGTGTIGSNYTGLRIWRDGDVGRIGGYNANTLQWYAGTDGKFYAGGGDIKIDADGIEFSADTGSQGALRWYSDFFGTPHHVGTINHVGLSLQSWMNYYVYDTAAGYPLSDNRHRFFINTTVILQVLPDGLDINGGIWADGNVGLSGYLRLFEVTAPSAPASNGAYLYLDDNGSGKTRLMVRFSSGSAVQLAIQP